MKYYYEKPDKWLNVGKLYLVDHPMFKQCTLFAEEDRGIIIIQEHYNPNLKVRWWGSIDPWLAYDIYKSDGFNEFFEEHARKDYPVFPVRKVMWKLKMKPLKKEYWEVTFWSGV